MVNSYNSVEIVENNKISFTIKKEELKRKIFSPGTRHYLHPKLEILEKIDCELSYFPFEKFIVVSFNKDSVSGEYKNSIISPNVDFVYNIINDFINHSSKYK